MKSPDKFSLNSNMKSYQPKSPQAYLDNMLKSRGYSTQCFCSLESGYYNKPTCLQKSSYGIKLVQAIRSSNVELISKLLSCGLSRNPCNAFGESVIHMVCRRNDYRMLKCLVDHGCSLQISDDFGRTPLHDTCWTSEPNFDCIELILDTDPRLLHILDCRGSYPLSYVKKENWGQWIDFFKRKKDVYWKKRDLTEEGEQRPPELVGFPPHSCPVEDPRNAPPLEIANSLSRGTLIPDDYLNEKKWSRTVVWKDLFSH